MHVIITILREIFHGGSISRICPYNVRTDCGKYTNLKHPLSIAIGLADVSDDNFENAYEVVSLADKRMYEDKIRIKKADPAISVRD